MASEDQSKPNGSGEPAKSRLAGLSSEDKRAAIRLAASDLVFRTRFGNTFGLSFDDKRSLNSALGYPDVLTNQQFLDRYERGGIAERIIEAYPRATWGGGAVIQEDPDPDTETVFEMAVNDLFERLDFWARILRADILSGLGRYAVLLIGAEGEMGSPLAGSKPESLLYLTPLHEDNSRINMFVMDAEDPRFGLPDFYDVQTAVSTNSGASGAGLARRTHWSRVLHVAEGLLQDDVFGKPRLRSIWNYLMDLDKIVGGGAEAAWKRADPGMLFDLDPEIDMDTAEQSKLSDELDEFQHGLRRYLRTRGMSATMLSTQVAMFGGNADSVIQLISATTGIPYRILTGSERGELASTQDRNNWNDRITERRRGFAIPLVRQFVDRLIEAGVLPEPDSYEVVWPDIEELTEQEKAEVVGKLAAANSNQFQSGGTVIMTADEIRDQVLGLDPLADAEGGGPGGQVAKETQPPPAIPGQNPKEQQQGNQQPPLNQGGQNQQKAAAAGDSAEELDRIIEHQSSALERAIAGAYAAVRESIDPEKLLKAIESGDRNEVERLVFAELDKLSEHLDDHLPPRIISAVARKFSDE